jgi:hypothetical protein
MNNYNILLILILQITTIKNAIMLGWKAEYLAEDKKIILTKKVKDMNSIDNNTQLFLDKIMAFQID